MFFLFDFYYIIGTYWSVDSVADISVRRVHLFSKKCPRLAAEGYKLYHNLQKGPCFRVESLGRGRGLGRPPYRLDNWYV